MSVFRVEKTKGYTVMSNHHLRNHTLSLKAKGLLSQMLSLPEDWDYTLQGLAQINKESIDAIREAVRELERAGYIKRSRERDERGCLRGTVYTIYEQPRTEPTPEEPAQALPTLDMFVSTVYQKNAAIYFRVYEMEGKNGSISAQMREKLLPLEPVDFFETPVGKVCEEQTIKPHQVKTFRMDASLCPAKYKENRNETQ